MTARKPSPSAPRAPHPGTASPTSSEVLVVGAGPGGSVLALLLARAGLRPRLLDRSRFPRAKACGECLSPGGVAVLERLGLLEGVRALEPAPLDGWRLASDGGRVARGRFGPGVREGMGIARRELDHFLVREAVAAGATLLEETRVVDLTPGTPVAVAALDPTGARIEMEAPVVVAADGLRSVVARRSGLVGRPPRLKKASATFRLRGEGPEARCGLLYLGEGFTVGLAPVSRTRPLWNGTLVVDPHRFGSELARDPEALLRTLMARLPVAWASGPEVVDGPWTSGPFDRPGRAAGPAGIVAVGDAAGYYDPLTGQGMYRALRSAELAAPAILRALHAPREASTVLHRYHRRLRREFAPGRTLQKGIEAVLSRGPLRRGAIRALARVPGALDRIVRVTGNARPARSLLLLTGGRP